MEEINVIETKEFKMPRLQHVRDLFIFSCYTGLAYADVMSLTQKSIVLGIDGERWIYTNRQKTDSRVRVPLLPKALAIIEKYKDNPLIINSGFLLPRLSNQKLNSYLDEIKNICEIDPYRVSNIRNHIFLKVYQCL